MCSWCGTSAAVRPIDLDPRVEAKEPDPNEHFIEKPGSWFMFFPEGPIAIILVLGAPVWSLHLISDGRYAAAIALLIGVGGLGYWAYRGFTENKRDRAYLAIIGILLLCYSISESWICG